MGISERRLRQQEEIRNKIIEQSWTIIEQEGWHALSIRRIADAIEYSIPVIYKHFENKEAIQEYFIKEGFSELAARMQAALAETPGESARIEKIASCYWEFAATRTEHYRIMFGLGIPTCETINSVAEMKQTSDIMWQAIKDLAVAYGTDQVDMHLKLKTFWSILHGFISIELLSSQIVGKEPSLVFTDTIASFMFTLINKK